MGTSQPTLSEQLRDYYLKVADVFGPEERATWKLVLDKAVDLRKRRNASPAASEMDLGPMIENAQAAMNLLAVAAGYSPSRKPSAEARALSGSSKYGDIRALRKQPDETAAEPTPDSEPASTAELLRDFGIELSALDIDTTVAQDLITFVGRHLVRADGLVLRMTTVDRANETNNSTRGTR